MALLFMSLHTISNSLPQIFVYYPSLSLSLSLSLSNITCNTNMFIIPRWLWSVVVRDSGIVCLEILDIVMGI